jgi:hypothetical protein
MPTKRVLTALHHVSERLYVTLLYVEHHPEPALTMQNTVGYRGYNELLTSGRQRSGPRDPNHFTHVNIGHRQVSSIGQRGGSTANEMMLAAARRSVPRSRTSTISECLWQRPGAADPRPSVRVTCRSSNQDVSTSAYSGS